MALTSFARVKALCDKRQWQKALPAVRERLRADPDETASLNLLAFCLSNTGRLDAAQAACARSLTLDESQANLWAQAASIALQRDDLLRALACITRADGLAPDAFKTRLIHVQVLMKAHRWAKVPSLMDSLRESEPTHPKVQQLRLQQLLEEERYAEAEPLARERRDADPVPETLNSYGLVLLNLGRSDEAVAEMRRGIRYVLNNPPRPGEGAAPRPYMDVGDARQALGALKDVLGRLRIPFFLSFGTLLGIVRDGELIPHDKDMDVGLPWKTPRLPLVEALTDHGFSCPQIDSYRRDEPQWYLTVLHRDTGITIDFFFARPVDGRVEMGFAKGDDVLASSFEPFKLAPIEYAGQTFMIPSPAERHLAEVYGPRWQQPDANYDTTLVGANLCERSHHISLTMGYNRLLGHLGKRQWKKAHGYCLQFQSVTHDPMIDQLRDLLESRFDEDWFPERPTEVT